jgi:hypothetical protein
MNNIPRKNNDIRDKLGLFFLTRNHLQLSGQNHMSALGRTWKRSEEQVSTQRRSEELVSARKNT